MEEIIQKMENEWSNLENYMGFEVPICLKFLLWKSGYDTLLSVKQIREESVKEIEKHIQMQRNKILPMLDEINVREFTEYKKQKEFEFLPGHRNILLDLP